MSNLGNVLWTISATRHLLGQITVNLNTFNLRSRKACLLLNIASQIYFKYSAAPLTFFFLYQSINRTAYLIQHGFVCVLN